ncbi:uncharacterized protein [Onthophagus taurus]|uniref:uncharacterized protein n=1 Tax=Onthophagus taurus TaxID=166361 RepID=UPI0039BE7A90
MEFQFQIQFHYLIYFLLIATIFSEETENKNSFNNIPLQDLRVVRSDNEEPLTNLVTDDPFLASIQKEGEGDYSWLPTTIKDIAYYLRNHKFNEYDRRYEPDPKKATRLFFAMFPRPPLRSLHWEAQKFCEPSFLECMEYIKVKLKGTGIKREDDTSVVIQEQKWSLVNQSEQIDEVENECRKQALKDDELADPFLGPLERFQWRTTVSYYLCWYTMNEVLDLKYLNDTCDNFANCLDEEFGSNNHDLRAHDSEPFACAMYSFCPDPCCPKNKHLKDMSDCDNHPDNPCQINQEHHRRCEFKRHENKNFHDIILNRWNVTCQCPNQGYKWSSKYGICIDIDECCDKEYLCDNHTEICVNMPGSYNCACKWGFVWDKKTEKCIPNKAIAVIKLERDEKKKDEDKHAKSIISRLYNLFIEWKSKFSR